MSQALRPWKGVIAVEGEQAEGRTIEPGAIRFEGHANVRLLGSGDDALGKAVGTVDRVWREPGDSSVWAEGLIVWPTAERVESVAVDVRALTVTTGGGFVVYDAAVLACVVFNSPNPAWPDRVGVDIGEVVGHAEQALRRASRSSKRRLSGIAELLAEPDFDRVGRLDNADARFLLAEVYRLRAEGARMRAALERIARQDYRGNRCPDAAIAEEALRA